MGQNKGRKLVGRLTAHERNTYKPGFREVFWDGRKWLVIVLPGGLYLRVR